MTLRMPNNIRLRLQKDTSDAVRHQARIRVVVSLEGFFRHYVRLNSSKLFMTEVVYDTSDADQRWSSAKNTPRMQFGIGALMQEDIAPREKIKRGVA